MPLSESTKRSLRTAYQAVLALIVIIPVIVQVMPNQAGPIAVVAATLVAAVTAATKVINALEDKGAIPAWLRNVNSTTITQTVTTAVEDPAQPIVADGALDYGDAGYIYLGPLQTAAAMILVFLVVMVAAALL